MKKPVEAVIEDVVIEPNKIQPIIVNFQNGHLKDEETKKMKCGLFHDEKKNKLVLGMSNGKVVYKGYRPDPDKELTCTMFVIHNKKTGKVRLVQAERWNVAPVLDKHVECENDNDVDKIASLNKQFGSKKSKRKTEQYERMKVNVDNVKEQLEKTVQNVEVQREDLEGVAKDDFMNGLHIPKCNRSATLPSEVYDIDEIVPKNILKTLYGKAVEVSESEPEEKAPFFTETVEMLKNDPKCASKIAILLYMEAVANWLNKPLKSCKGKDLVVCPHSPDVNKHVLESYSLTGENGRQRPNTMRDKGLIHCIILGLTIYNYKLNLEKFSTFFGLKALGIKKLLDLSRYVLAVPMKEDKKTVVLKLPLPQDITKLPGKKKKSSR